MLSVVIPVLNGGESLLATLRAVMPYADETIVVDGGSTDQSVDMAEAMEVTLVSAPPGRGGQLAMGAEQAEGDWLLFLHADTLLTAGWREVVDGFIARDKSKGCAGYFQLAFDDSSPAAARTARLAMWRAKHLGLPYGDQGLLISRSAYDALGGFRPLPLMEDVDFVRRIGRRRLIALQAIAITSAEKYRRVGWRRRSARNLVCLGLYYLGFSPSLIAKLYG
jgi:rSAM/selenodomain-associated transferase 2